MTELLLLRHAESVWNQQGRFQGWADPPLSSAGAASVLAWSATAPVVDAIVSSDLERAVSTARLIAHQTGVPLVEVTAGLREQNQGDWTGLTKSEVKRAWPDRYRERPRRPINGEDAISVLLRLTATLGGLASRYAGRRILVVTHAGAIRVLEGHLGAGDRTVGQLEGRWLVGSNDCGPDGSWRLGPMVPGPGGPDRGAMNPARDGVVL